MAKKPKLQKARVATERREGRPEIPVFIPLVMEERDKLSSILNDPVFVKAWANAEAMKPSVFARSSDEFKGQFGDNNASKVLHTIQGWELHKSALLRQTIEIVTKKTGNPEAYPAEGSLEAEISKTIPKSK